jgi:hypothetical protein
LARFAAVVFKVLVVVHGVVAVELHKLSRQQQKN